MKIVTKTLILLIALTLVFNVTNITKTNEVQAATNYKYSDWEYHSTIKYSATAKKVTVATIVAAINQFAPSTINMKIAKIAAAAATAYYSLSTPQIYVTAVQYNKWVTNSGQTLKPKAGEKTIFYFYSDKDRKNLIYKDTVYEYTSWWQ